MPSRLVKSGRKASEMLSEKKVIEILNAHSKGMKYTAEEASLVRDILYKISKVTFELYSTKGSDIHDTRELKRETSNCISSG